MSYKYSWSETDNYYYDATLTQSLLNEYISDQQDSSGHDAHRYYINWGSGSLYDWPSKQRKVVKHNFSLRNRNGRTARPAASKYNQKAL